MTARDAVECLRKMKWNIDAGSWGPRIERTYADDEWKNLYEHKQKQLEALDWAIELIKESKEAHHV